MYSTLVLVHYKLVYHEEMTKFNHVIRCHKAIIPKYWNICRILMIQPKLMISRGVPEKLQILNFPGTRLKFQHLPPEGYQNYTKAHLIVLFIETCTFRAKFDKILPICLCSLFIVLHKSLLVQILKRPERFCTMMCL